jgi:TonB family protein
VRSLSPATHETGHFNGRAVLEWREPVTPARILRAGACSAAVHLLAAALFLALPETRFHTTRAVTVEQLRKSTPLILPRDLRITQRDPNEGKVRQELDIRSALPARPAPPRVFQPPAPSGPRLEQTQVQIASAPQLDVAVSAPQIQFGQPAMAPPVKPPRAILEDVTPAPDLGPRENPLISAPKLSPEEMARNLGKGGGSGGGALSGDGGQPAALGEMQLLSDPQGVDFKPYLLRVLAAVRQNWFAIIPPEARTGRPGLTIVQFKIDRQGGVPKVVISNPSGVPAFDRTAVAAISASYPFPPLPAEYRGQEISLQLAFSYNLRTVR